MLEFLCGQGNCSIYYDGTKYVLIGPVSSISLNTFKEAFNLMQQLMQQLAKREGN